MADSDFLTACGFTKCEGESRECELADPFLGKHVIFDDEKQAIEIILTRFQNGEEVDGVREII